MRTRSEEKRRDIVRVAARAFEELRIESLLDRAFALKPGPAPFHADGASRVAERLALTCGAMSK